MNTSIPEDTFWFPLRYRFMARIGKILAGIPVARTRKEMMTDGTFYIKERPWYIEPVVQVGNAYLNSLGTKVRVCGSSEWMIWEPRAYQTFFGLSTRRYGMNRLLLPELPGRPLASILASGNYAAEVKLQGVELAIHALQVLHQQRVTWPDGQERPFSHADATVKNVLIDLDAGTGYWIDFETLHDSKAPASWRQADDLRALLYSAARYLERSLLDDVCRRIVHACRGSPAVHELSAMIRAGQQRPNAYHLAQDQLTLPTRRYLDAALLRTLDQAL